MKVLCQFALKGIKVFLLNLRQRIAKVTFLGLKHLLLLFPSDKCLIKLVLANNILPSFVLLVYLKVFKLDKIH